MKCANKLGNVQKALTAFAGDKEQAYPWYMTAEDGALEYKMIVDESAAAHNRQGWNRKTAQQLAGDRGMLVHMCGICDSVYSQSTPAGSRQFLFSAFPV